METYNKDIQGNNQDSTPDFRHGNRTGRLWGGLFIILIGVLLFARQTGANIPDWIFSFESILIAFGIYMGIRHSFRRLFWLVPVLIGGFLLIDDLYPQYDLEDFTWPLIIIAVGLLMIIRAGRKGDQRMCGRPAAIEESADDVLDSTVIFGGSKKNIISKNFRGGEAVTVFGGTELNMMQADLTAPAELELTQVFGGTKLVVPAHWKIQSKEMVTVMGGIDDKRPALANPDNNSNQTLILKGTCVLGGIEIRSY